MKSLFRLAVAAGIAVASVDVAGAATTKTAVMTVSMDIVASCTFASVGNLVFPSQTTTWSADLNTTATFSVNCSNKTPYALSLGQGGNYDTANTTRRMKAGASFIPYKLCQDAACTQSWGEGTEAKSSLSGTGFAQAYTVYGRVAANTAALEVGSYTDSVTISVTY